MAGRAPESLPFPWDLLPGDTQKRALPSARHMQSSTVSPRADSIPAGIEVRALMPGLQWHPVASPPNCDRTDCCAGRGCSVEVFRDLHLRNAMKIIARMHTATKGSKYSCNYYRSIVVDHRRLVLHRFECFRAAARAVIATDTLIPTPLTYNSNMDPPGSHPGCSAHPHRSRSSRLARPSRSACHQRA